MKLIDKLGDLNQFERSYEPYKIFIHGIPIWDFIRPLIWDKMIGPKNTSSSPPQAVDKITKLKNLISLYISGNPIFTTNKDYVFLGHGNERRKHNAVSGKFEDVFSDTLIQNVPILSNSVIFEHNSPNNFWKSPTASNKISYLNTVGICRRLLNRLGNSYNLSPNEKLQISELSTSIENALGLDIDLVSYCKNNIPFWENSINSFSFLLKRIRPRCVFVVCSYGGRELYLLACKRERIPTIELQHCAISNAHAYYHFSSEGTKHSFPDYYFSYGSYWTENVRLPCQNENIIPIGYPFLAERKRNYFNSHKKKQFLFISQKATGMELSEFAIECSKIIPKDWEIIFKLHPQELSFWRQKYRLANYSRIKIIDSDTPFLYELLAESPFVISVSSTVLFESLVFKCQPLVYQISGSENFKPFVDCGDAIPITYAGELLDFASESISPKPNTERYFVSNWKSRFRSAVEFVCSKTID